jgi:hypothetical protein
MSEEDEGLTQEDLDMIYAQQDLDEEFALLEQEMNPDADNWDPEDREDE